MLTKSVLRIVATQAPKDTDTRIYELKRLHRSETRNITGGWYMGEDGEFYLEWNTMHGDLPSFLHLKAGSDN